MKTERFVLQCRGCSCLGAKHFLCKKLNWDVQKESFGHDVIAFVLSQGIRTVCLFFFVEFAECVAKSKVPQQTDTTTPLCDMSWASNMNTDEKLRFMNILSDHAGCLHISSIYRI